MLYSITSSARARSVGGTVTPSAFAVLRLITSSYFVGACTGRHPGLRFRLIGGKRHEHADLPHPLTLLGTCRERPHRSSAERTEKFAPPHMSNPRLRVNKSMP
jgi:hypothetical protein